MASVLATSSSWRTSTARCSTRIGGSTSATRPGADDSATAASAPMQMVATSSALSSQRPTSSRAPARSRAARWSLSAMATGDQQRVHHHVEQHGQPDPGHPDHVAGLGRHPAGARTTACAAAAASTTVAVV